MASGPVKTAELKPCPAMDALVVLSYGHSVRKRGMQAAQCRTSLGAALLKESWREPAVKARCFTTPFVRQASATGSTPEGQRQRQGWWQEGKWQGAKEVSERAQ